MGRPDQLSLGRHTRCALEPALGAYRDCFRTLATQSTRPQPQSGRVVVETAGPLSRPLRPRRHVSTLYIPPLHSFGCCNSDCSSYRAWGRAATGFRHRSATRHRRTGPSDRLRFRIQLRRTGSRAFSTSPFPLQETIRPSLFGQAFKSAISTLEGSLKSVSASRRSDIRRLTMYAQQFPLRAGSGRRNAAPFEGLSLDEFEGTSRDEILHVDPAQL